MGFEQMPDFVVAILFKKDDKVMRHASSMDIIKKNLVLVNSVDFVRRLDDYVLEEDRQGRSFKCMRFENLPVPRGARYHTYYLELRDEESFKLNLGFYSSSEVVGG